mmetsp:Transcript_42473/g.74458  ORF Transcript_42473/g.74458 Transcript_42473/m.74458 type:complete len:330 (-) Transcript_42473:113-1102(-)
MKQAVTDRLLLCLIVLAEAHARSLKAALAVELPCSCLELPSLLQGAVAADGGRPRDCTCINGMKTYATTPRDKLQAMTKVQLRYHLKKCNRERKTLEDQQEYEIAEHEVRLQRTQDALNKTQLMFEGMQNRSAKLKAKRNTEAKELMSAVRQLETEMSNLTSSFTFAYGAWYDEKSEVHAQVEKLTKCKSLKSCPKVHSPFLLQTRLNNLRNAKQPSPDIYDLIQEVEECEEAAIKIASDMKAHQKQTNDQMLSDMAGTENVKRRMVDYERMSKMLSKDKQIENLINLKHSLQQSVKVQQGKVDLYASKGKDLKTQVEKLKKQLVECKC